MKIKRILFQSILVTLLLGSIQASYAAIHNSSAKSEVLFVVEGDFAKIYQSNGATKLFIRSPMITYFTDRPKHRAGIVKTSQFKNLWAKGASFQKQPPNAYIAALKINGQQGPSQVDRLINPQNTTNGMVFDIKQIDPKVQVSMGALGKTAVFVDDLALGSCGASQWQPGC